tara:strand:- start:15 stop:551 length:537 start_codon:yes stop_codon:yes gene_type:complete
MKKFITLMENYISRYPNEKKAALVLQFLKKGGDLFSNTNKEGHFTGSAWIINPQKNKVLLTHHKKLNKWIQLGGHADGEKNLLSVALREAREESGIKHFTVVNNQIFDVDIHPVLNAKRQKSHLHYDIRFLFKANPKNEKIITSKESFDVAWVPIEKISELNPEKSLTRMIKKTILLP